MAEAVLRKPGEWSEWLSLRQASFASYLVGFYIFAHYLELGLRFPALGALRFHLLFGLVVAAVTIPKLFRNKYRDKQSKSLVRGALMLIFVLGIYAAFSMDPEVSRTVYSDRVVKFAMMSLFIYAAVDTVDDLRVILLITLLAWMKMGQEGLTGWLTGSMVWENQGIPRLHGSSPAVGHPNSFSGFAVGCLPFGLMLQGALSSRIARFALWGLLGCALIIIVATGSRTGYVAALAGGLLYLFVTYKGLFKKAILLLVGIGIASMVVPQEYQERFTSIFTGEEKEGQSSERRKEIVRDAIEVFKAHPQGIGVGAFPRVRWEMFGRSQNTHNQFLELLTNASVLGVLAFTVFVWRILAINRRNLRRIAAMADGDEEAVWRRRFLAAVARATIGFIFLRLILGLFGMDTYEIYWWFALGLTLAVNKLLLRGDKGQPI
jgi:putative inorganic carbon (HCO3(-)) transporter